MEPSQILRPLTAGEILDRAFRLYRNHFLPLIGIVGLVLLPLTVLQIWSQITFGTSQIVNLLQNLFFLCFLQGSLTFAISGAYLGKPVSIGSAYRSGLSRYGSLWGAFILEAIVIAAPLALLLCAATSVVGLTGVYALLFLTVLLFVPYIIFFSTRWLLSVPGIMLEELGASRGLGRSWDLTSGVFWRIFGISLLSSLLSFFITQLPGMAVVYGLSFFFRDVSIGPILELAVTGLSTVLTWPFSMGVIVLLYYDLRVRKEGYDLELQTEELSAASAEPG